MKAINDQSRQLHIDNFLKDIELNKLKKHFEPSDIELLSHCSSASIQFARGSLNFFISCMRVYYQDINFLIVEAITKLFKAEIKLYNMGKSATDDKKQSKSPNKQAVLSNVYLVEKIFSIIRKVFLERTGVDCKYFIKLSEKLIKFKEDLN
jgi:hypothetical protein